jgi:hypothetical protein
MIDQDTRDWINQQTQQAQATPYKGPATYGEIASSAWQERGLHMPFGFAALRQDAVNNLARIMRHADDFCGAFRAIA